ncbi:MAG: hypothetical protein QOE56_210 [Solirubrobacterales bacterium]|nr:hypothetical protein [Solirubrobacterales bacterium]
MLRAARLVLLPTLAAVFLAVGANVATADEAVSVSSADAPLAVPATDAGATTAPAQELTPDPPQPPGADYGTSTAISGNTVLVGAPNDTGQGSVTVFALGDDGTPTQQGSLTSPGGGQFDFGASLATDGSTIAVGAPGSPTNQAVDVYDAATYALIAQLLGSDAGAGGGADFGSAVAVSGDWLVVGAPGAGGGGLVYIYSRQDGAWVTVPYQVLTGADDSSFGQSVAIDGLTIVVGAPGETLGGGLTAGAVHVYTLVNGEGGPYWSDTWDLSDPNAADGEAFGSAVAIDGTTIAVGAPSPNVEGDPGRVVVYTDPFGDGASTQTITGGLGDSLFGQSLGLGGSNLAIGYVQPDGSGAVDIYSELALLTSSASSAAGAGGFSYFGTQTGTGPGDGFGKNVAASGQNIVIGADGHAYLLSLGAGAGPAPAPGPAPGSAGGWSTPGAGSNNVVGATGHGSASSPPGHGPGPSSAVSSVVVQPKPVAPAGSEKSGNHRRHAGKPPAAASQEQPAATGRSSFAGHLLLPGEIDLSAANLAEGGLLAFILAALLYLPVMIFNKTTERNHETISGWFAGPRGRLSALGASLPLTRHPLALLVAGGMIGGFLFAFVEPGFPSEEGSLQYLVGMMLGLTVVGVVFFATWREVVKRLEPDSQGRWRLYSPYILLAAVLVVVARLAHFLPGVVLGTLAEYEPGKHLSRRTAGLRVLITYGTLMALGAGAWFAWIPVEHAAAKEGASSLTLILDAALAVTFVTGLESAVFGLIPLKFLDGHDLFVWHKGFWLALWGLGLYWFSVVILHPALSTYNEVSGAGAFWFGILFSALMVIAMSTWAYFTLRNAREARIVRDGPPS